MAIDSLHPQYSEKLEDWTKMRDTYKGERTIKLKGTTYLPATKGMILDGMGKATNGTVNIGQEAYDAYRTRALFPDYVAEAVEAYIGLLHQKPPTIELPSVMEPLRDRATLHGESLEALLRRINEEQLVMGRCGLLLDLPVAPDQSNPMPYVALYVTEAIKNWDDGEINEGLAQLNLVVLDESNYKRDADFEWKICSKYRILMLNAPIQEADGVAVTEATYIQGVFTEDGGGTPNFVESAMLPPMLRGQSLKEIPFVFVNSKDIVSSPDKPPLLGLANMALAIYRGEADYRQNLFMQGQDTLVVVGDRKKYADDIPENGEPLRTGAGSMIELEAGGSAEYIGVQSQGLSEQRSSLENDRKRAETRSGQLIDSGSGQKESGEALKTRIGAQAATLNQIAKTGAGALEMILKSAARWMGADESQVRVEPNLEFSDLELTGKNLVDIMTARALGAPISKRSIHSLMLDKGLTKLTYEEEKDLVEEENAGDPILTGTKTGGNPGDN